MMDIVGVMLYIINGLMAAFSFNQFKTEQQKPLIVHGILFFTIALLSIFLFDRDYFFEAFVSLTIFGSPLVFSPGITPEFLFRNTKRFTLILSVFLIIFLVVVFAI
jgi:hypothetical protein